MELQVDKEGEVDGLQNFLLIERVLDLLQLHDLESSRWRERDEQKN